MSLQLICTLRTRIVWLAPLTCCTSPLEISHILEQPPGAFCAWAGSATAATAITDRRAVRSMSAKESAKNTMPKAFTDRPDQEDRSRDNDQGIRSAALLDSRERIRHCLDVCAKLLGVGREFIGRHRAA